MTIGGRSTRRGPPSFSVSPRGMSIVAQTAGGGRTGKEAENWDAECHTLFRERGNEAPIRVPRMFKSHAWQQLINRCNVINKRVIFLT
jgi:hypothetical protein